MHVTTHRITDVVETFNEISSTVDSANTKTDYLANINCDSPEQCKRVEDWLKEQGFNDKDHYQIRGPFMTNIWIHDQDFNLIRSEVFLLK